MPRLRLTVQRRRWRRVKKYLDNGMTQAEIARRIGVSRQAVHRYIKRHDLAITSEGVNFKKK